MSKRSLFFVILCLISESNLTPAQEQDTVASYRMIDEKVEDIFKQYSLEKSSEKKFIKIQLSSPKKDVSLEWEILQALPEHIENLFNKISIALTSANVSDDDKNRLSILFQGLINLFAREFIYLSIEAVPLKTLNLASLNRLTELLIKKMDLESINFPSNPTSPITITLSDISEIKNIDLSSNKNLSIITLENFFTLENFEIPKSITIIKFKSLPKIQNFDFSEQTKLRAVILDDLQIKTLKLPTKSTVPTQCTLTNSIIDEYSFDNPMGTLIFKECENSQIKRLKINAKTLYIDQKGARLINSLLQEQNTHIDFEACFFPTDEQQVLLEGEEYPAAKAENVNIDIDGRDDEKQNIIIMKKEVHPEPSKPLIQDEAGSEDPKATTTDIFKKSYVINFLKKSHNIPTPHLSQENHAKQTAQTSWWGNLWERIKQAYAKQRNLPQMPVVHRRPVGIPQMPSIQRQKNNTSQNIITKKSSEPIEPKTISPASGKDPDPIPRNIEDSKTSEGYPEGTLVNERLMYKLLEKVHKK